MLLGGAGERHTRSIWLTHTTSMAQDNPGQEGFRDYAKTETSLAYIHGAEAPTKTKGTCVKSAREGYSSTVTVCPA